MHSFFRFSTSVEGGELLKNEKNESMVFRYIITVPRIFSQLINSFVV